MTPKNKIVLTAEQEAWFLENYASLINIAIAEHLGCSLRTVVRLARARGLVKDMAAIEGQRIEKAVKALKLAYATRKIVTHPENGIANRFKPGHNPREQFGDDKFAEMHRKSAETRRKTFALERARHRFGLPQRTRLRVGKQPRQKILDRCYLRRRGYILDEPNCVAYWTATTQRATKLEAAPRRFYIFKQHPTL